jgi:DNA-binding PadR family transcriptional regulator
MESDLEQELRDRKFAYDVLCVTQRNLQTPPIIKAVLTIGLSELESELKYLEKQGLINPEEIRNGVYDEEELKTVYNTVTAYSITAKGKNMIDEIVKKDRAEWIGIMNRCSRDQSDAELKGMLR